MGGLGGDRPQDVAYAVEARMVYRKGAFMPSLSLEQVAEYVRSRCIRDGNCLLWTGPMHNTEPRMCKRGSSERSPHRTLWKVSGRELGKWDVLQPGLSCDYRCINPAHRKLITRAEHLQSVRTTTVVGNRRLALVHRSKSHLNMDVVREIRSRYASGEIQKRMAEEYKVCQATISHICNHRTWKELGVWS